MRIYVFVIINGYSFIREVIDPKRHGGRDRRKRSTNKGKGNGKGKSSRHQRRTCDLTIVADHLFFRQVGESSVEKTVLQMLWHIKVPSLK